MTAIDRTSHFKSQFGTQNITIVRVVSAVICAQSNSWQLHLKRDMGAFGEGKAVQATRGGGTKEGKNRKGKRFSTPFEDRHKMKITATYSKR